MLLINNEKYFLNQQLESFLALFKVDYVPSRLIICDHRLDLPKLCSKLDKATALCILADISVWDGQTEAEYIESVDTIIVYVFAQNDDGEDKQSKQLYSLHALVHELRHRYYTYHKTDISLKKEEKDCDKFATKFIKKKSAKISQIMDWEDEWEVEE